VAGTSTSPSLPLARPGAPAPGAVRAVPGGTPVGLPAREGSEGIRRPGAQGGLPGDELIVRRDRWVARQGDPGRWFLLLRGFAREQTASLDGRRVVLDLLGPGDVFGGSPGTPLPSGALALTDVLVKAIDGQPAAPDLCDALAERARRLAAALTELSWLDVPARVERRLGELAARLGRSVPDGVLLDLPLTQDDLAALCATTRESTNRALRALERAGRVRRTALGYVVRT
jgi:CRP/FNR family cyclic AMP-dependent transcriptional regulator